MASLGQRTSMLYIELIQAPHNTFASFRILAKIIPKMGTAYQNLLGNRLEWEKLAKERDSAKERKEEEERKEEKERKGK